MARVRNLKPGFFTNEDLAECSCWARLCFAGLWTISDREGRMEDRPKRIKGLLFPMDNIDVDPLLDELQSRGFVYRYTHQGMAYLQIISFHKHQNPHFREPSSSIPAPESLGLLVDGNYVKPGALDTSNGTKAPDEPRATPPIASGSSLPVESGVSRPVGTPLGRAEPGTRNPEQGTQSEKQKLPTPSGSELPIDPDPIFGTGLAFLRRKGISEKPARSFLGKLRKDLGDLRCVEVLAKAESEDVSEPLAWLRAAAEKRGKVVESRDEPTPDWLLGAH